MIIFRYLCKEILGTLLATTLILLIIFMMNQFVHYFNDAAAGKITVKAVMEVMSLQVPLLLGYLIPLGLFFGGLLALGRMMVDHELVVLRACGVSRMKIVKMIMMLALLVTIIVAWLMLWVEPRIQWYQGKILTDAVTRASLTKIIPGRFQIFGNSNRFFEVFYAGGIDKHQKRMINIFLAKTDTKKGYQTFFDLILASEACELDKAGDGHFIFLKNGFRYIGTPGKLNYDVMKFNDYGIRLTPLSSSIDVRIEAMQTTMLWKLRKKNLKAAAELQWRIAMPVSVLAFALLIVPLSELKAHKWKFAQMLPAILIYIIYANLMFLGRVWIIKGVVNPVIGLWWVHVLLGLIAVIFLFLQSQWWLRFRVKRTSCAF
ncbi:LPS export ABC transporter permease LptF [Coxiella endosymbiont of Amblyomma nuttalli]|uniref:LPS export ABC transporter permease LptF n=1 Tax=Coxiella endosymbiont of Amblyomma nuttalli TaxID=2749996 RepID=UPI001BB592BE|nr:LPS export ABC transporter permease LptF [Coxiella endosymbiont of Amblyomma nuttalli]QTS84069.1 Lipopolysaccharide export system permease protein LptF [Coxiella endosymbiont of Amblyomma nuttalli]